MSGNGFRGGRGGGNDRGFRGGRGGGNDRGFRDNGGRGGRDNGGRGGGRGGRDFERRDGGRGGRGGMRGGRGGGRGGGFGGKGGAKNAIVPHDRYPGVFIGHGRSDTLLTLNMVPGKSVYNEKLVTVDGPNGPVEYREWNPYRSKIGATILVGIENLGIKPGCSVLYLGAASGTTVSHVSDIVGPTGCVYAVEFSHRVGRELVNLAKSRPNIVPIIEDARHPQKYRMLVPMCDYMFADVAQPDQARIFTLNGDFFLKNNGGFMLCVKASCVDSTLPPEKIYEQSQQELTNAGFKCEEKADIDEYHRGHACLIGTYRPTPTK